MSPYAVVTASPDTITMNETRTMSTSHAAGLLEPTRIPRPSACLGPINRRSTATLAIPVLGNPRNPDTDGDGLLDGADPSPAADTDGDNDVDLEDFWMVQQCYTGADSGPVAAVCICLDSDGDDDIDELDYQAFSTTLSGP
jgi:hypothetical protein